MGVARWSIDRRHERLQKMNAGEICHIWYDLGLRDLFWMGSSLEDVKQFPEEVRREIGYALFAAQRGQKHPSAKPLKGFTGATVLEIVEDFDTDTFRAINTV